MSLRIRLSTLILTVVATIASVCALRLHREREWYSQDEIDGWAIRARIDLADIGHLAEVASGQIKTLVCRAEDPEYPSRPWYWHAIAATTGSDPFRPVAEDHGWAPSRTIARRLADDAGNVLLDELLWDADDETRDS